MIRAAARVQHAGDGSLARWRQELEAWPTPALIAGHDGQVVAVNALAAAAGATAGNALDDAIAALHRSARRAARRGDGIGLHFAPLAADDFDGWFIDAADVAVSAAPDDAAQTIAKRLAASNLKLQEQMRRRRFLERQVLTVAEQEKKRISLELHDGLGQHLTGVAFVARALCDALAAGQHDKATDAEWLVRLLNEAIGKTRAMARGLWPVNLERESFVLSLQRLADDLESIFGVSCAVQVIDTPHLSSNIAAHHVFRVMQEAATNAIKHGQARRLTFRVQHHGGDLVAIVSNDGLAPVPEALADPQGLGVVGMRLRADALGGRLDVGPMAGGGCCVTLTLPGAAASPTERARDETSAISSTEGSEHDR